LSGRDRSRHWIGAFLILLLWAIVDVVLGVTYLVTRRR
jgi:hypothetical protein